MSTPAKVPRFGKAAQLYDFPQLCVCGEPLKEKPNMLHFGGT